MRHRLHKATFGRKQGPRVSLIRGLVSNLVEHGRIKTTLPKAKELRRHVERAITMGKKGTVHCRRILFSRYPNKETVKALVNDLAVRFKDRPGGYTKIIKLGFRPGDRAEMAYIQFVDYQPADEAAAAATASAEETVDKKRKDKLITNRAAKYRKHVRQIQNRDRRTNRSV